MGAYQLGAGGISSTTEQKRTVGTIGVLMALMGATGGFLENNKIKIQLHTGNPGVNGTANVATENKKVEVGIEKEGALATAEKYKTGRATTAPGEWPEVKAAEKYTWVSVWPVDTSEVFSIAIELTLPVEVKIGDTFRINTGKLVVKVKES